VKRSERMQWLWCNQMSATAEADQVGTVVRAVLREGKILYAR